MLQLAYYSRNGDTSARAMLTKLREILKVSQDNNHRDGLTGYLVFDRQWFVQVLEGDRIKVRATFNRIQRDTRHTDVVVCSQLFASGRTFPGWSMGATARTEDTEEIFIRHGLDRAFDPRRLKPMQLIALASELQDHALAKSIAARRAAG